MVVGAVGNKQINRVRIGLGARLWFQAGYVHCNPRLLAPEHGVAFHVVDEQRDDGYHRHDAQERDVQEDDKAAPS